MKKIHQILSVILMICLVCASIGSVAAQNYDMLVDENIETKFFPMKKSLLTCIG